MTVRLAGLLAAGLVAVGAAAADRGVTVKLSPPPRALAAGQAWTATVRVAGSRGRPTVVARSGAAVRRFAPQPAGRGTFLVRIVLPAPGRWTLEARLAGRTFRVGAVTVRPRRAPPPAPSPLREPFAIAFDPAGNLLIANGRAHNVLRANPATRAVAVLAGTGEDGFSGDGGPARSARVGFPIAVAADRGGNVYVVTAHRVRRIDPGGTITTVAGTGEDGYSGDGGPAASARLGGPVALAVDAADNLFIAEYAGRIRRVDASTGVISTVAGIGREASSGDGGPALQAAIDRPHGVAVAPDGTVYVADTYANRVRRIDAATGVITTVAGTGEAGFSGDGGPAAQARLNGPVHVAVAPDGSVLVSDRVNDRVRRVSPAGVITTVAGTGVRTTSGDGGPASRAALNGPGWVAVDAGGNIFVGELEGVRIRRVDASTGIITTAVR